MHQKSMIDGFERRGFLRSLAGGAGSISLGAGASMFAPFEAQAQSTDYRALVCLFLFGGNDGMNMVVPLDDSVPGSGYSQYASVRGSLALPSNALQALSTSRFGLHPGLAPLTNGTTTPWRLCIMLGLWQNR
jgi:uncharacterized protein (DUF1501 family)